MTSQADIARYQTNHLFACQFQVLHTELSSVTWNEKANQAAELRDHDFQKVSSTWLRAGWL